LTNFNKLFGFLVGNNLKLLNCILLNALCIIYSCKYSKRKPNLNLLFVALQRVKKSEHIIAKRNNTFLDIYTNGPYKLIFVIVICTVFIYVLFYLQ